ncbi:MULTISPECIES: S1 RNA-binding domain-containing protein [Prochlorococcus]|uniref:3'-to-5' exoribonuclease RNase R n=1 Tax=Prochlorococcus marinus str. MIT 9116 TaxID=167544 RepID=A0A0A1ZM12_PROMR|nr:S1 RNA-binding domain-containing protein [Prochlorococcus marinus]KGF89526.1 3'-to-5' exoribonuclease RNase R [Prochlorococcus marinus str. MIT 9107]KGF90465.1 3'-to-5' exoribonuclease RNase R [Prochlorococcus marinus str. MIT 9116]KGF92944.1 3'-to-5' exoribonuclease RNase R [Prochlorococcus marinus str. MIT 9123]
MFTTSLIIDNLNQSEGLEYKKLCRSLKITKKSDKDKLDIALKALEKLEIINKNENNEYNYIKDSDHIVAKIRCSSKGYCFAVRENNKEDIYIKENLLNYAWNGDKVLVRIIKEGYRRRSPEGIVDCILERSNQILLSKVETINDDVYAIPIDDRILSKIKLPKEDKKYTFKQENKNIVKVEIDRFPIGQEEGIGHVIKELPLNNNEELDTDFVLSKSNILKLNNNNVIETKKIENRKRIDLSNKNSYLFKSWNSDNSPILPMIQIDQGKDDISTKLWIHTNNLAEIIDLNSKKSLEIFFNSFESLPLLNNWQNYLCEKIRHVSEFRLGEKNKAISLCLYLNCDNEITEWSFHLTLVKCSLIVGSEHTDALLSRKSKTRITSRILKPIKPYIKDLDKILEISKSFRQRHLLNGKVEIPTPLNKIESLDEFFIHNPAENSKVYFEPLTKEDCQTYLSPILHEGNLIWFKHANKYGLNSAGYILKGLDYINANEIIKYSDFIGNDVQLNEDGNLSFSQLIKLCDDDNKKRILHKLLINEFKENEVSLISKESDHEESEKQFISPWTTPGYDFMNLINQYCIFNMIINGKKSKRNNINEINIMESNSWKLVNWDIFSASTSKNIDTLFNKFVIDKLNEYKNKVNQYKTNMISLKKVRKAEKLISNTYSGFIMAVQSYGFFVEISDLNVEGLVHVSTLNNDWYEYRSRQNLLIGRKSKKSYKVGDEIEIKIIKVDILKYQIDLELT